MRYSRRSNKENYPYSQNNPISNHIVSNSYVFSNSYQRNKYSKPIDITNNNMPQYNKYLSFGNNTCRNKLQYLSKTLVESKEQNFQDCLKVNSAKESSQQIIQQKYMGKQSMKNLKRNATMQVINSNPESLKA